MFYLLNRTLIINFQWIKTYKNKRKKLIRIKIKVNYKKKK